MIHTDATIFTSFVMATTLISVCLGECVFPDYLFRSKDGTTRRTWTSHTFFRPGADDWSRQREILVESNSYTVTLQNRIDCYENGKLAQCSQRETLFKRVCQRQEYPGVYRMSHYQNTFTLYSQSGKPMYTCLKFIRRNANLIQVYETDLSSENSPALCEEDRLERIDWPWISTTQDEVSYCPVNGGFDFRTFEENMRIELCKDSWRPSRLESECIMGEGLEFTFPAKNCSIFKNKHPSITLTCWGDWVEGDYLFIIASEPNRPPQFAMRFPNYKHFRMRELPRTVSRDTDPPFSVNMYFSPTAPLSILGLPTEGVEHFELRMRRSDTENCYDESESCQELASEGRCTSTSMHQFANYCKRSCNHCSLIPNQIPECHFPTDLQGQWVLFEKDRTERISVSRGSIRFSKLGRFICKGKHWQDSTYKMFSSFNNGCRPRFSCMRITQEGDGLMRYKISRSSPTDESFGLCEFHNDPPPMDDLVRSTMEKVVLPLSQVKFNTCQLKGIMETRLTRRNGEVCKGTVSDLNPTTCMPDNTLVLRSDNCQHHTQVHDVFRCEAYAELGDTRSILISSTVTSDNKKQYRCWIIQQYAARMSYKPWRDAYLLPRAQCGNQGEFYFAEYENPIVRLVMATDSMMRPCHRSTSPAPKYPASTTEATKSPPASTRQDLTDSSLSHEHYANPHMSSNGATRIFHVILTDSIMVYVTFVASYVLR